MIRWSEVETAVAEKRGLHSETFTYETPYEGWQNDEGLAQDIRVITQPGAFVNMLEALLAETWCADLTLCKGAVIEQKITEYTCVLVTGFVPTRALYGKPHPQHPGYGIVWAEAESKEKAILLAYHKAQMAAVDALTVALVDAV